MSECVCVCEREGLSGKNPHTRGPGRGQCWQIHAHCSRTHAIAHAPVRSFCLPSARCVLSQGTGSTITLSISYKTLIHMYVCKYVCMYVCMMYVCMYDVCMYVCNLYNFSSQVVVSSQNSRSWNLWTRSLPWSNAPKKSKN